ncbi:MAG: TetR/AcrR family transcriptional regulator [Rhodospirillum sp.]|nr:TetR/AcrR family transcriptional regulator [Rhodospirillum sp.]MCF8488698.1 TetR/AcrR family transcriptional regulator [Rhodospirillum sp.]
MSRTPKDTRGRIIDAASSLFYADGIRAVSVDAVAERAGVTKKTLYYHFTSKDELVAAYLAARDQPNLRRFAKWYDEGEGEASDRVAVLFQGIARAARHPKWRGCGFLRTVGELANLPGHPAMRIGAAHKKAFEALLADRFHAAGLVSPEATARQVAILMDGAFSALLVHRDPAYADAAGEAARALVASALPGGRDRSGVPAGTGDGP